MSVAEIYTKGARVWLPDPEEVWRGAQLVANYTDKDDEVEVAFEENEELDESSAHTYTIGDRGLPPLRNPDILIGENDLTSLSYLNEPEVLYNLRVRFCDRREIYTYCGIVLVAINPYEELPIYGPEIIQAYSGQDMGAMDPHIFAVAEEAFKRMSSFDKNQSVIVSGESGAGKTVSAKYTMRYFATVGGAQTETQVERRVLASNPIMEAIGNAKTTRNDNSSRFGKFIEIGFNRRDRIVGANMRTYLLEKSRVVFQSAEERNYHVFYQLCAAWEGVPEFAGFELDHQDAFFYTSQGGCPDVDDVDDAAEFESTREALSLLGVVAEKQIAFFQILAGILHMGNIAFAEAANEGSSISKSDRHLIAMARLLGVPADQMRNWFCHRSISVIGETVTKPLTVEEAANARDALAKHLYSELFQWTVYNINKALATKERQCKFIGVLDIYGFETFEVNSFEQFCINYANEKLQQQFNMHVFKLEQEEYIKEAIEWSFIDFYDNQPCIDLIESKLGILDLLDEECKMPKGSDANWCQKLYQSHLKGKSARHFSKPKMSNQAFIIAHFADDVEYYINGFLEKNRDTVLQEQLNILKASDVRLVAALFEEPVNEAAQKSAAPGSKSRKTSASTTPFHMNIKRGPQQPTRAMKKTVGSQFRDSLCALMETLNSTTPHYVRCIKPNDEKMPFSFCPRRAVQQLRACGVLETVRISAAGFPSRWSYAEFFARYRVLARGENLNRQDIKGSCARTVESLISDPDKFRLGKTKLFFRAGQVAYLEKLRSERLRACGVMIQKHVRGWLQRRRYQRIRRTVLLTQTHARAWLARRRARQIREARAALRIQTAWRAWRDRRWYCRIVAASVTIQCAWRRCLAVRLRWSMVTERRVVLVQAVVRGWLARRRYRRILRAIIKVQSHFRRRKARKEYKALRIEARSIDHIKTVNKGLENKIIELQMKLDDKAKVVSDMRTDQERLAKAQTELVRLQKSEVQAKSSSNRVAELEAEVARLRAELKTEKGARDSLEREKSAMTAEHEEIVSVLREEKVALNRMVEDLEKELVDAREQLGKLSNEAQDLTRSSIEMDSEREHHQRLLGDYSRLQQKYENLYRDYEFITRSGYPPSRNSSTRGSYRRMEHRRQRSDVSDVSAMRDLLGVSGGDTEAGSGSHGGEEAEQRLRDLDAADEVHEGEDDAETKEPESASNIFVLLSLRKKIDELDRDNKRLRGRLDQMQQRAASRGENANGDGQESNAKGNATYYNLKTQEYEMENAKLKQDLDNLRRATSSNQAGKEVVAQLEAMRMELDNRREECIQLRSILASKDRTTIANDNYGGECDLINEDGELEMAFKTQKEANRRLQIELDNVLKEKEEQYGSYEKEIDDMRKENERLNRIIGQDMSMSTEQKVDACMQHEITRLTSDNLDLRETNENLDIQLRKYKRVLRTCVTKLQRYEGSSMTAEWDEIERLAQYSTTVQVSHKEDGNVSGGEGGSGARRGDGINGDARDSKQLRQSLGMIEYKKEDEQSLLRNLIYELQPRIAVELLPGLPAYILFMCIRHTDYKDDDERVRSLLSNSISAIRRVVKKRSDSLELLVMWLANTIRLLNCLKQYSGEKAFSGENSPSQNQQTLANFDLSDFRQILSDLGVFIYQALVKLVQEEILPPGLIIAAVLDYEGISGLTSGTKPAGMRGRSGSQAGILSGPAVTMDTLLKKLTNLNRVLCAHGLDVPVVEQLMDQAFFWVAAHALNNLLLRKDLCNWSRGMQIRYNISQLETWIREHKLRECSHLNAMTQASQLLQAKKTDENVETICGMCPDLRTPQIVKLLNLYTPVDEYENRVSVSLIRAVVRQLESDRDTASTSQPLLINTKHQAAVSFPFSPSHVPLETLHIPESLGLTFLRRL